MLNCSIDADKIERMRKTCLDYKVDFRRYFGYDVNVKYNDCIFYLKNYIIMHKSRISIMQMHLTNRRKNESMYVSRYNPRCTVGTIKNV